MMNSKALIAVAVAAIIVVSAVGVFLLLDQDEDGSEERTLNANVYIDNGTATPYYAEGSGRDITSVIKNASGGMDVQFNSNGTVRSVDGRMPGEGERWVVWRWASPDGWASFSGTDISGLPNEVSIAVHLSRIITSGEGSVTYEPPDIEVEYKIYFFIQLREQYSANEWIRSAMGTEQDRRNGQWFSATGSTVMEAFEKVVWGQLFTGQYTDAEKDQILNYRTVSSQLGWLDMFMGWTDTLISGGIEDGMWTYWSQYNWTETGGWEFDNLALGRYDITDHRHFALILQTTVAHDTGASFPQTYPEDIPEGI